MSKLETQKVEDVNISYNPEIGYVIDISYRRTDKNGNVDIISISDIPIYIANYPIIDHQFNFYDCCDTCIDLGFGKLVIKADLKDLKIKFIPCENLEMDLKNINQGGEPSLKHKLEKSVVAKLIDMYKELI